jgi:uncharacterized protein
MKTKTTNKKKLQRAARSQVRSSGPPLPPTRPPVRFSVMAKPIGPACNLRCKYCFYLEKEALFDPGQSRRMSDEVLEAYVRKYIEAVPAEEVTFHWQGGEPTLMGIEFFRKAVRLQRQYANGKRISNTLQTNGTLLDDSWGKLLREGHWLVGLSLDGPEDIHNANRPDASGQGSFGSVIRGLGVLQRHGVEYNVLCSVTPTSSDQPMRVYEFLRDVGVKYVQFMPIVERLPDAAASELGLQLAVGVRKGEGVPAVRMTPWSVRPEAYGKFLSRIFDEWVRHDVGTVFVMNFEWAFAGYLGLPPRVCQFMPVCGLSPIIEHNGDIYACDHYVYPEYRLGNILTDDLQDMVQSTRQKEFGQGKCGGLPQLCLACPVVKACWGECPKRRFTQTPDGAPGLNYLCAGYLDFLLHAAPYFEALSRLKRAGQPASDIMNTEIYVMPRGMHPPGTAQDRL